MKSFRIAARSVQWNAKCCGSSARCHLVAFIEIEIFSISGCIRFHHSFIPSGSMYGIYTYIYHKNHPNVGKYTIHGSTGIDLEPAAGGIWNNQPCQTNFAPPGLPDPGRIQKICVELGVVVRVAGFFPMCSLAKCLKKVLCT